MGKNRKAITDFYNKERPKLLGYIRKLLSDSTDRDAEDLVQDVMLSLYGRDEEDTAEEVENIASYIYSALKNRIVDAYRKKKNKQIYFEDVVDTVSGFTLADILADAKYDTHSEVEKKDIIQKIYKAVDKLKPEQKAVWIATEIEGYTFEELSLLWQAPLGTLLARKHRAVLRLRKLLVHLK
jgi:RNA polymerase sigma factor (sigma-70 family)